MFPWAVWAKVGAVVALLGVTFASGWKVAAWRCEADANARQRQEVADANAAMDAVRGVSAAYQGILSELRRLESINRVEVQRETIRTEYRCVLPAAGGLLLDRAIDAANGSAARPAAALPADRQAADR